jgi:DNA-directed RNA polymerase subunit RPC12/RpoP
MLGSLPPHSPAADFETLLRDGIRAVKNQQPRLAQSLLRQATLLNSGDARPYLWLSATTSDPTEQREYLEQAVARDPTNVSAKRGLAVLNGKLKPDERISAHPSELPAPPPAELEAEAQTFQCPQCGGRMRFDIHLGQLTCEYCGQEQESAPIESGERAADLAEQPLDLVMPTRRGHAWAGASHRMTCLACGAQSLFPPGWKSIECPYCGANGLVESTEMGDLLDPQLTALMKVDAEQAARQARKWLGSGLFAPDDLRTAIRRFQMRPAYYSCWTFDGEIELKWSCQVNVGTSRYPRWESRTGVEARFFDDVLIPGVKALRADELRSIEPFRLKEVEEFRPEHLAGWPAILYDRSVSDASLEAREKVTRMVRPQLYSLVEPGHEKRSLQTNGADWVAVTFKHVLLPLWIGTYHYRDQEYHLLINGQTGKVGGKKPVDAFKIMMLVLMLVTAAAGLIWLLWDRGLLNW